jgi:hypothetical protein
MNMAKKHDETRSPRQAPSSPLRVEVRLKSERFEQRELAEDDSLRGAGNVRPQAVGLSAGAHSGVFSSFAVAVARLNMRRMTAP